MGSDILPVAKPPEWLANKPMPKTPGKSSYLKGGPSRETENAPPQKAAAARKSLGKEAKAMAAGPAAAAKPARKSAVFHSSSAPLDQELKQELRDTQELLEITQADETDAKKELQHLKEQVETLEETLRQSEEREEGMATLLETLGQNAITLHGVEWTVDDARQIMAEEKEAEAKWDALIEQVQAGRQKTLDMIAEQEALQVKLQAEHEAVQQKKEARKEAAAAAAEQRVTCEDALETLRAKISEFGDERRASSEAFKERVKAMQEACDKDRTAEREAVAKAEEEATAAQAKEAEDAAAAHAAEEEAKAIQPPVQLV